jgi:hypothetical protein
VLREPANGWKLHGSARTLLCNQQWTYGKAPG